MCSLFERCLIKLSVVCVGTAYNRCGSDQPLTTVIHVQTCTWKVLWGLSKEDIGASLWARKARAGKLEWSSTTTTSIVIFCNLENQLHLPPPHAHARPPLNVHGETVWPMRNGIFSHNMFYACFTPFDSPSVVAIFGYLICFMSTLNFFSLHLGCLKFLCTKSQYLQAHQLILKTAVT